MIPLLRSHDHPKIIRKPEIIPTPYYYRFRKLNEQNKKAIRVLVKNRVDRKLIAEAFDISHSLISIVINGKR